MNKTDLLDRFARDGESRLLPARILDQQQRAQQRSIPTHTGVLSPAQQAESADLLMAAAPGQGLLHGGYPDAERKLWAFLPDWLEEETWLAGHFWCCFSTSGRTGGRRCICSVSTAPR